MSQKYHNFISQKDFKHKYIWTMWISLTLAFYIFYKIPSLHPVSWWTTSTLVEQILSDILSYIWLVWQGAPAILWFPRIGHISSTGTETQTLGIWQKRQSLINQLQCSMASLSDSAENRKIFFKVCHSLLHRYIHIRCRFSTCKLSIQTIWFVFIPLIFRTYEQLQSTYSKYTTVFSLLELN